MRISNSSLMYWGLAFVVALGAAVLSVWFYFSCYKTILWPLFPFVLVIAFLIWICHQPQLPKKGSFIPCCAMPPPVLWVMVVSGMIGGGGLWLVTHAEFLLGILPTASVASTLAIIFYTLLLPRLLAWHAANRLSEYPNVDKGEDLPLKSQAQCASDHQGNALVNANHGTVPWDAPYYDKERSRRLFQWIAQPESPIVRSTDDLFDIISQVSKLLEFLRPVSPLSNAGTVNLRGARGSGKSSLLRLAAETEAKQQLKQRVTLRFCFLSLWDYSNAEAALRGIMKEALEVIRDRIDILLIAGLPTGVVRAVFGISGIPGILGDFSVPTLDLWLSALSELLVRADLRFIFCIEDDDRITTVARRADHCETMQGFLDHLKDLPGFGYVICTSTRTWSEPSPDEPSIMPEGDDGTADGTAEQYKDYNERWFEKFPNDEFNNGVAPPMTPKEMARPRTEIDKNIVLRRSRWAKSIAYLPVSRLCQYDLLLGNHLKKEDIGPIFNVFRLWMVQQIYPEVKDLTTTVPLCKMNWNDRNNLFTTFLKDYSDAGLTTHITSRVLRNALREAARRWRTIVERLKHTNDKWKEQWMELGIDFDSVLVACLLRACLPERWPGFLEFAGNFSSLTGLPKNFVIEAGGIRTQRAEFVGQLQKQVLGLGLSGSVWNMLSRQDFEKGPVQGPGGIIGIGAKDNWRLFAES